MADLFHDRADDYDARPVPQQISEHVSRAMREHVTFSCEHTALDFGAGTGLVTSKIAPLVGRILAVDVSPAMLAKLAEKPELEGRVEVFCQDLLVQPLDRRVDRIVSAMAAHHVHDTDALLATLFAHLVPGGVLALADLDAEDGSFHPPDIEGVHHHGFDREALAESARRAGFVDVSIRRAGDVDRDGRHYPLILLLGTHP